MVSLLFAALLLGIVALVLAIEGRGTEARALQPAGLLRWMTSGNWPAKVGGALLIVGIGALLRYALVNVEVPPALKLSSGVLLSAALALASNLLPAARTRRAVSLALGGAAPNVIETQAARHDGADGYTVVTPDQDTRRDYATICDASGAKGLLDTLIPKLRKQGEITLAGFYEEPLSFTFPPAFMREARIRIAAEFTMADMQAVKALVADGRLSLSGLISHHAPAATAASAYEQAFTDPNCIKMALDWSVLA